MKERKEKPKKQRKEDRKEENEEKINKKGRDEGRKKVRFFSFGFCFSSLLIQCQFDSIQSVLGTWNIALVQYNFVKRTHLLSKLHLNMLKSAYHFLI